LGVFALALGIAGVMSIVARFGVGGSAAIFIAQNRDDPDTCARVLRDALRLTLLTATFATVVLFVAAGPIASAYDNDDLVWPLRGVAVAMFAETLLAVYLKAFIAAARIAVNLRLIFLESLAESGATLALVLIGAGATGAAFGRTIGYSVGAAAAAVAAVRAFGRAPRGSAARREPPTTRAIVGYALPLLVIDGIYGVFARVDVLVLGAMLSATAVGLYAAPLRLIPALSSVAQAVSDSVAPRQARSAGGQRVDAFQVSMKWLIVLYAAVIVPMVVWAEPIVSLLFGAEYAGSVNVLRLLAPYVFLSGIAPLVSTTVNFLGGARRRIPIALAALGTNLAIDVALIPVIGVEAAPIGLAAAFLLYVPAHLEICRRALGFPVRPLLLSVFRALLAAAAAGGVMAAAGTESLSLHEAAAGTAGGIVTFTGVLLATREISTVELRQLTDRLRRPGSRRPG
jgi:O-antigen/teichoic acid export membrane protein